MKFIASLFSGIILSIMLMLTIGLILKCDHINIIEVYSFQSENSTAMSCVKSVCEECEQSLGTALFRDNPPDESYIGVIEEHIDDKIFVKGEYDTVRATVIFPDYDADRTRINCSVRQGDIKLNFMVEFKGEYEDAISLLQAGDEITFYGKSALKGLSWTDCELKK